MSRCVSVSASRKWAYESAVRVSKAGADINGGSLT